MRPWWIRALFPRPSAHRVVGRRPRLRVEGLEGRDLPATLDLAGGVLTYTAAAGVNNSFSVTVSGSDFVFADAGETITTGVAGSTGSGTNSVTVPVTGVTAFVLNLGDGTDAIAAAGISAPAITRTVTAGSSTTASPFVATVTTSAAHGFSVGQSVTVAGMTPPGYNGTVTVTGVPSATTFTYAVGSNLGAATAFGTAGGAANGALAVTISQTGAGLTVGGPISVNGNVSVTADNALTLGASIFAGSGTITLRANQDGSGAEGLSQTAGIISSTNTTNSAVGITVNTAAGGTGTASLDNVAAGTGTTGGRLTVDANAGSIVYAGTNSLSTAQQGTANGGSAPARVLAARSYVFTATGGGIGTSARPMQLNDTPAGTTVGVTATAGPGGVYVVDWGENAMSVAGATATGAGAIRLVAANGGGHNLVIAGNVSTGSGDIYLASDDNLTVNGNVTIGGAGFSGTVWMQANRDKGTAGQTFTMAATAAIVTSNATNTAVALTARRTPTTQAVYLDIAGDANTAAAFGGTNGMSALTVGNIQVGNGGRIVLNAAPNAYLTSPEGESGAVAMAGAANLLDAGPAGTVELIGRNTHTASVATLGSATTPIRVAGGTVIANSNYGSVYVTGTAATAVTATVAANTGYTTNGTGSPLTGQSDSAAVSISLATTAGALTVGGATAAVNGGAVTLSGAGGVVLGAQVGGAGTGAVSVTGPLTGTGNVVGTGTVTVTQATDSTYSGVISGARGLTKTGAGNLTVTAAQTYTGATAVTDGTLTVGAGGLTGTSGVTVAAGATLANAGGAAAGPVAVAGTLAPSGDAVAAFGTGDLSFTTGGVLALNLNAAATAGTDYDQVTVTGAVTLTNAGLRVFVGSSPALAVGQTFTVIANDAADAVTGTFTGGPQFVAFDNPAYVFTASTTGGDGNDVVLTLTAIRPPRLVDVTGGNTVVYSTAGAINSGVSVTVAGGRYVLTDTSGAVTLSSAATAAGWTVDGPNTVSGPVAGVTAFQLALSDGTDAITGFDGGSAAVSVVALGSLTTSGTVTTTGNLTFTSTQTLTLGGTVGSGATLSIDGVSTLNLTGAVAAGTAATLSAADIAATPAALLTAPVVGLTSDGAVGSAANPVRTQADTITAAGGAGGVFVSEADGATVTATATGAGAVAITNGTGTLAVTATTAGGAVTATSTAGALTVAGPVGSLGGAIALSSGDGMTLAANVNAGTGTIAIAANTDGAGGEGLTQTAGTVTTTNTGAAAVAVTVNTAGGGTGNAAVDNFTVGSAAGGRLSIDTFGGSIRYGTAAAALDAFQRGVQGNGGTDPARLLRANVYSFTTGADGGVGTDDRPMQVANFGTNGSASATANLTAAAGAGGVYITGWDPAGSTDTTDLTVGAVTAQGAGNVRIVTANAGGHNLFVTGAVTTGSGSIYLAGDDNFVLTGALGGPGFSGTVYLAGNRDTGNTVNLQMNAGASITTSNATAAAVLLEGFNLGGTRAGGVVLNTITVGDGGTITVNTATTAASQGTITAFNTSVLLDAGPTGRVVLTTAPQASTTSTIGTAASPIRVTAGTVVATALTTATTTGTASGIFVTGTGPTAFTAVIGGTAANAGNISLATTAGVLTVAGATSTVGSGTITLTGADGVVVSAPLGGAATGAIAVTGPLSGAGDIALGTGGLTLTQGTDSTYDGAVSGASGVTKAGAGVLTLTGTSTYTGATTLSAGGLRLGGGVAALAGTSGLTVADGATAGGAGAVAGPVVVSGTLAPGAAGTGTGVLTTGNLSFAGAGGRTLAVDLNGTAAGTGYDQLGVTGTVNLTGATLAVAAGFAPAPGDSFTIISNDGTDAVTGTFAGLAQGATLDVGTRRYAVSYTGGDGNDVTLTVTLITADPPVNAVPGPQSGPEDTDLVFSAAAGNTVTVSNPTLPGAPVKVTLAVTTGTLTLATVAGLTFAAGDGTADATMTFAGSLAAVNAALDGLRYTPVADDNGPVTLTVTSDDQGATGGPAQTDTDTVSITVVAVNDAPAFTKGADQTVAEDAGAQTATGWATGIATGPANESGQTVTFLVTTDNPALFAAQPAVGPDGMLTYTPAPNAFGTATVTVRVQDNGTTANGGIDTSSAQTFTITVTPVNDAPVVGSFGGTVTIFAGPGTVIAPAATVTDPDTPAFAGATLTVTITAGGRTGDVLGIRSEGVVAVSGGTVSVNGTPVGAVAGGTGGAPLVVTFNADATPAAAQEVLRHVAFRTPAPAAAGDRTVTVVVTDGQGGTSPAGTVTVTVPPNAPPTVTVPAGPVGYTENGAPVFVVTGAAVTDLDSADFDGGTLTVDFAVGGTADDVLTLLPRAGVTTSGSTVLVGGTPVGTVAGGTGGAPLVVTFNADATPAAAAAVVESVAYSNASDAPSTAPRSVRFVLTDGNDGTSAPAAAAVEVTAVNDGPTNHLPAGPLAATEDTPLTVTGLSVSDPDAAAGDVRVTLTAAAGTVTLSGTAGLVVAGNGTAVVDLTGPLAAVNAALNGLTFTPAPDFNGPASIQVRTDDLGSTGGGSLVATDTLAITVAAANDAPVLTTPAAVTTDEDTAVVVGGIVVADADAGAGQLQLTLSVGHGTLTTDTGVAGGVPAGRVSGNGTATVVLTGTLAELNATLAAAGGPTYTPAGDFNGPDTLAVAVDDLGNSGGAARTASAAVPITVTPVNDVPVAQSQAGSTDEDTAASGQLTATDVDGPALTFAVVGGPANGTLAVDPATGAFTYTPNADFHGTDSFTFKANDGSADSNVATVSITVTAVNDAPVAAGQPVTTDEDTPVGGTVTATDIESPTLTFTVVASPANGTLAFDPATGTFTYTPNADFHGSDSFTFRASDGAADSNVATVAITVAPVNDAPAFTLTGDVTVAEDAGLQAVPGFATGISAGPADEGGQSLTFSVTVTGTIGGLTFTQAPEVAADGTLTFRTTPDATGTATVLVTLTDGGPGTPPDANSTTRTFTIAVTPVNDPPVFTKGANQTVAEDSGPQTVLNWASGIAAGPANEPGQTAAFLVTTNNPALFAVQPAVGPDGTLTYTPAPNAFGTATVSVRLRDDAGGLDTSAAQTFVITVTPVNDPPAATGDTFTLAEDSAATAVPVLTNDSFAPDAPETLTVTAVTQPAHGTVTLVGGVVRYTPAADYFGADSFTYTISDGNGGTATATVAVTVTPVNDTPVANPDTLTVAEDGATDAPVLDNDSFAPDAGETLSVTAVTQPAHGTVTLVGGVVRYAPNADYFGTDSFTYTISDGNGGTATAAVSVTVTPVNDPPVAFDDVLITVEDSPASIVAVLFNDLGGPDTGETLSVTAVTPPAHGVVTLVGGVVRYTPSPNYFGADTFSYTVSDGNGGTATGTVAVSVFGANDPPTAVGDTFVVDEDSPATVVPVLANDSSAPDAGETLTVTAVGAADHGIVTLVGGVVRYAPAADYFGADSFTYTLSDGNGGTATGTVTVTVTPVNDPPVAIPDTLTVAEDAGATEVSVLTNDTTAPEAGEALTVVAVTQPARGTVTLIGGVVRYTPAANYSGPDSFTYTVSDGGETSVGVVAVTVTPANDPPTAVADDVLVTVDVTNFRLDVLANDSTVDAGEVLAVTAVTQPAGGSVSVAPGGVSLTFTPAAGFVGTTTFTYTVGDGTPGSSATATVTVTVLPPAAPEPGRPSVVPGKPVAVGGATDGSVRLIATGGGTTVARPFGNTGAPTRTATADVNNDGVADLIAVTGPGTPLRVAVLSGTDQSVLVAPFDPFGGDFPGGGYVAAADLDGDGRAEFVVTPDQGGGPRVTVFGLNPDGSRTTRANFLGIDDTNFRGGARAALGDVNTDGTPDVVVAAGFGGGPRTAIFTGQSVLAGNPTRLVADFFAFPGSDAVNLRNGAFVASGDVDGDGFADLVFGGGPGGAPRVFILSGALVSAGNVAGAQAAPVANFFVGGDLNDRGGARVAVTSSDGDTRADVAVGSGEGRPSRVRMYLGKDFAGAGEPTAFQDLDPFGGAVLTDGVFVG